MKTITIDNNSIHLIMRPMLVWDGIKSNATVKFLTIWNNGERKFKYLDKEGGCWTHAKPIPNFDYYKYDRLLNNFFNKESEFPKKMRVSELPFSEENKGCERIVFCHNPNLQRSYLTYTDEIKEIDDIENYENLRWLSWKYAEPCIDDSKKNDSLKIELQDLKNLITEIANKYNITLD